MGSYDLFLFTLKIKTSIRGTNSVPFLIFRQDHLRSEIICGAVQYPEKNLSE